MTTASSPCVCSCERFDGSSRLPPGSIAAFDLRKPSMAACRLSAGSLDEMHSHILCEVVAAQACMNASCACAGADRPIARTMTEAALDTQKRMELLLKGLVMIS